ncbi:uncharacterized protein LOC115083266 [Rhinatrema bivittatum]|uniref:uncharacterized protein LOC115083266 n=1 Tax=Rhinatrema bivittatum TaxID=194408 RepID=UPI00112E1510|nr:uncharacterized protein LOC115083266 [Rhinatrema bivittatum]
MVPRKDANEASLSESGEDRGSGDQAALNNQKDEYTPPSHCPERGLDGFRCLLTAKGLLKSVPGKSHPSLEVTCNGNGSGAGKGSHIHLSLQPVPPRQAREVADLKLPPPLPPSSERKSPAARTQPLPCRCTDTSAARALSPGAWVARSFLWKQVLHPPRDRSSAPRAGRQAPCHAGQGFAHGASRAEPLRRRKRGWLCRLRDWEKGERERLASHELQLRGMEEGEDEMEGGYSEGESRSIRTSGIWLSGVLSLLGSYIGWEELDCEPWEFFSQLVFQVSWVSRSIVHDEERLECNTINQQHNYPASADILTVTTDSGGNLQAGISRKWKCTPALQTTKRGKNGLNSPRHCQEESRTNNCMNSPRLQEGQRAPTEMARNPQGNMRGI